MKRALKILIIAIFVVLTLAIGTVTWLLNSSSGLSWIIKQSNGVIEVDSIQGDISDFSFEGLEVNLDGSQAKMGSGSAELSLAGLLKANLSIESLLINDLDVVLPPREPEVEGYEPWAGIELPIDLEAKRLQLNRLSMHQAGAEVLALDEVKASVEVDDSVLRLHELTVKQAGNRVSLEGVADLRATPNGQLRLSHQTQWNFSQSSFAAQGEFIGTWQSLRLEQNISQPYAATLSGQVNSLLSDKITWRLALVTAPIDDMVLADESVELSEGVFQFDGELAPEKGLAGMNAQLNAQLSGGNPRFSQWQMDSEIRLINDDLVVDRVQLEQASQGDSGHLQISGTIDGMSAFIQAGSAQGRIDLKGSWQDLSWPLSASAPQVHADGSFSVAGSSDSFTILADAKGQSYAKPLQADVEIVVSKVVENVIEQGAAQQVVAGRAFDIKRLKLVSAGSILVAQGKVAERYDLSWDLRAADIGDFVPRGSGGLVSLGKVTGAKNKPNLDIQASSKGLSYLDYSISQFELNARVAGAGNTAGGNTEANEFDPKLDIRVNSGALRINQSLLAQNVEFAAQGLLSNHRISLDSALANNATLSARIEGGLKQAADQSNELTEWSGILRRFQLNDPKLASWQLKDEVVMIGAQDRLNVSPTCLENGQQSLCLQLDVSPDVAQIDATLSALDLANLNRFTSLYDITISGQLDGQLAYQRQAGSHSGVLQSHFESQSTSLTWQDSADGALSDETLVIESIDLDASQDQTFKASAVIDLQGSDQAVLELTIDSSFESAQFKQAAAKAKASLDIEDLSMLPAVLLPSINLNGSLDVDASLDGSLAQPQIVASAELQNAYAEIPELGLRLEELEFDVTSAGTSKVDLNGKLRSGQGELNLRGNVDFLDITAPTVNFQLAGEQVQLANTAELDIVGDLDLNAKLEQGLAELSGSIKFAKAVIDYKLPESAILASNDVVLEGEQHSQTRTQQKLRVNVDLGQETRIKAKGLDANLLGNVVLFQDPGGILRADGEIRVDEGRYKAYGQDLKIDQGSLIFGGGSVDDPSLSLSAEKTVDTITAGVSITGRASAPRLELYSTPTMPDEDILSVLVFGKPVGNLASQDGLTLLRIANSLRGGGGSSSITKITDGLQQSLGLTSLELQLDGNSPSIVAGKQLSSKFYVGYGYGLLDAVQSLILRYQLNQAWSIKADVGADSGADLRYQIER